MASQNPPPNPNPRVRANPYSHPFFKQQSQSFANPITHETQLVEMPDREGFGDGWMGASGFSGGGGLFGGNGGGGGGGVEVGARAPLNLPPPGQGFPPNPVGNQLGSLFPPGFMPPQASPGGMGGGAAAPGYGGFGVGNGGGCGPTSMFPPGFAGGPGAAVPAFNDASGHNALPTSFTAGGIVSNNRNANINGQRFGNQSRQNGKFGGGGGRAGGGGGDATARATTSSKKRAKNKQKRKKNGNETPVGVGAGNKFGAGTCRQGGEGGGGAHDDDDSDVEIRELGGFSTTSLQTGAGNGSGEVGSSDEGFMITSALIRPAVIDIDADDLNTADVDAAFKQGQIPEGGEANEGGHGNGIEPREMPPHIRLPTKFAGSSTNNGDNGSAAKAGKCSSAFASLFASGPSVANPDLMFQQVKAGGLGMRDAFEVEKKTKRGVVFGEAKDANLEAAEEMKRALMGSETPPPSITLGDGTDVVMTTGATSINFGTSSGTGSTSGEEILLTQTQGQGQSESQGQHRQGLRLTDQRMVRISISPSNGIMDVVAASAGSIKGRNPGSDFGCDGKEPITQRSATDTPSINNPSHASVPIASQMSKQATSTTPKAKAGRPNLFELHSSDTHDVPRDIAAKQSSKRKRDKERERAKERRHREKRKKSSSHRHSYSRKSRAKRSKSSKRDSERKRKEQHRRRRRRYDSDSESDSDSLSEYSYDSESSSAGSRSMASSRSSTPADVPVEGIFVKVGQQDAPSDTPAIHPLANPSYPEQLLPVFKLEEGTHPSVVWNDILHTVDDDMRPFVKWEWVGEGEVLQTDLGWKHAPLKKPKAGDLIATGNEFYETKEDEPAPPSYQARLRLTLPGSHPTMQAHRDHAKLPTEIESAEYRDLAETMGGVRVYEAKGGAPMRGSAQNATIALAIELNVISWIKGKNISAEEHGSATSLASFNFHANPTAPVKSSFGPGQIPSPFTFAAPGKLDFMSNYLINPPAAMSKYDRKANEQVRLEVKREFQEKEEQLAMQRRQAEASMLASLHAPDVRRVRTEKFGPDGKETYIALENLAPVFQGESKPNIKREQTPSIVGKREGSVVARRQSAINYSSFGGVGEIAGINAVQSFLQSTEDMARAMSTSMPPHYPSGTMSSLQQVQKAVEGKHMQMTFSFSNDHEQGTLGAGLLVIDPTTGQRREYSTLPIFKTAEAAREAVCRNAVNSGLLGDLDGLGSLGASPINVAQNRKRPASGFEDNFAFKRPKVPEPPKKSPSQNGASSTRQRYKPQNGGRNFVGELAECLRRLGKPEAQYFQERLPNGDYRVWMHFEKNEYEVRTKCYERPEVGNNHLSEQLLKQLL